MATTRGRLVQQNQVVLDQADFFQSDGFSRVVGLTPSNLVSQVFFNNLLQPWPLVSGLGINDPNISSGKLYFNEVPGSPGFYNVRFRPNAIGYWRVLLTYSVVPQIVAQDYDVTGSVALVEQGLSASFIKPPGSSC